MIGNQKRSEAGLIPYYFKKVGVLVMILAFIPLSIIKSLSIEVAQVHKELLKLLSMNMFILGLLFVACAKDKFEDEMKIALRLKSMSFAFIWAVLFVIIKPLIDVISKNRFEDESARRLVISMLFVYLIFYNL
jgi:hypothetical protein